MPIIIIAIILLVVHCIKHRCKSRRTRRTRGPARIPTARTVAQIEKERREREKAEKAAEKQAAAERRKEFQRMQAADDLIHLQQQKHDVLILYGLDECIVNDPDKTLAARRAAYSRNITRNDQVRRIEKQIEKAQFILTEP